MAAALKVFTRGTLTFFEITIVVFFIASLAAMAALGCLGARKRNRASEISGELFNRLNRDAVLSPGDRTRVVAR